MGQARFGAEEGPYDEGQHGNANYRRDKPRGHTVGQALDGGPAPLCLTHHLHNARQQGFAAYVLGAHYERSRGVNSRANHTAAWLFRNRHRLASDHRFVDCAGAFENYAVDRDLFPRTHPQAIAGFYLIEWNVLFRAIAENACGLGAEVEQRTNRSSGTAAGAEFQDLSQEHEGHDGGSGFEVDRRIAAHVAERCGKNAGKDGCGQTEKVGHPCAHGDQREHVGRAIDDRRPSALKERPATPQDNRRGQQQFDPR